MAQKIIVSTPTGAGADTGTVFANKINSNFTELYTDKHVHTNKTILDGITAALISAWNASVTDSHTHSNKAAIDTITAALITNWNSASTDSHTHANKTVLDAITALKVTEWDNKQTALTVTQLSALTMAALLKNDGVATEYLDGTGNYSTPAGGGSGDTTDHAALSNLSYENSGHTGFATAAQGALADTSVQKSDDQTITGDNLFTGTNIFQAGITSGFNIDLDGNPITNVADPSNDSDASTKAYTDTKLSLSGGTMSGDINMGSNYIQNAGMVLSDELHVGTIYGKGTNNILISANIDADGYVLKNLNDPSDPQEAATKNYVDTSIADGVGTSATPNEAMLGLETAIKSWSPKNVRRAAYAAIGRMYLQSDGSGYYTMDNPDNLTVTDGIAILVKSPNDGIEGSPIYLDALNSGNAPVVNSAGYYEGNSSPNSWMYLIWSADRGQWFSSGISTFSVSTAPENKLGITHNSFSRLSMFFNTIIGRLTWLLNRNVIEISTYATNRISPYSSKTSIIRTGGSFRIRSFTHTMQFGSSQTISIPPYWDDDYYELFSFNGGSVSPSLFPTGSNALTSMDGGAAYIHDSNGQFYGVCQTVINVAGSTIMVGIKSLDGELNLVMDRRYIITIPEFTYGI